LATEITTPKTAATARNLILAGLPAAQLALLTPHLEFMDLPQGHVLVKPDVRTEYLYFLEHGLASTDAITRNGRSVEVGVTGREGVVGFHVLLGQAKVSHLTLMQGAGAGFRIRASVLKPEFDKGGEFLTLVHAFLYSHIVQVSQSVLCNRLHEVEARLARWLLMASDHTESDHLVLTQEFIAQMLGSTRSTVTITAGELQDRGVIDYSRGKINILDRSGLEQIACECYEVVRHQYQDVRPRVTPA
jgi:CRP-like cAMP-binding protein